MTFWTLTNSDFYTDQTFHQFHDFDTELDLHRIMSGFHGAFSTDMASQQGTLTLPDTWFRPLFWTCLCSICWDQVPRTCYVFTRLFTLNTHRYFLDFPLYVQQLFQPTCSLNWDFFIRKNADCEHAYLNLLQNTVLVPFLRLRPSLFSRGWYCLYLLVFLLVLFYLGLVL